MPDPTYTVTVGRPPSHHDYRATRGPAFVPGRWTYATNQLWSEAVRIYQHKLAAGGTRPYLHYEVVQDA